MKHIVSSLLVLVVQTLLTGCNANSITANTQENTRDHGKVSASETSQTAHSDIELLMTTAVKGDAVKLKDLADRGVNLNTRYGDGDTALIKAATEGHRNIIGFLLNRGADVNARGRDNRTALINAAANGHTGVVKLLLASGADINVRTKYGETAFTLAGALGHPDLMEMLLANGAQVTADEYTAALVGPAGKGDIEAVKYLLSKGANPTSNNKQGISALANAASNGHISIIRLLLDNRADMNANGGAALRSAAGSGHIDIVRLLLDRGADANMKGNDGLTSLMLAIGNAEITKILLDKGADPNAKTESWKWTPLMFGAKNKSNPAVIRVLVSKGADLEAKDIHGNTALMLAAKEGHIEAVKELIAAGANVNASNQSGADALMGAAGGGRLETVRALLSAGADVNVKQTSGWTALMLAAGATISPPGSKQYESSGDPAKNYNYEAVVKVLLAAGADVNAVTDSGETALALAKQIGRTGTVELLRKAGARE